MHFLGVDIGSSYTKFAVINGENEIVFSKIIRTISRDREEKKKVREQIFSSFEVKATCATGYGRELLDYADVTKTEIYCASEGVTLFHPLEKTIIDIGGEDVKVVHSAEAGKVLDFYMNTKCAAGTGTFITEIAERAEIKISDMSELAARSNFNKELNSFCTVFAKTEIMKWLFDDTPTEDIAKGIYISIVNRINKIRMDKSVPVYLIGGVAAYHPYLKNVMEEMFEVEILVPTNPQMIIAIGAAVLARKNFEKNS